MFSTFPHRLSLYAFRSSIFTAILLPYALSQNNPPGTCYYPSGNVADGFFPCDPTAFITQCCPTGWTCFSNSLCVVTDPRTANSTLPLATTIRSACTNPKWNNAICGQFCLSNIDDQGGMNACGDDNFCCAGEESQNQCNCDTKNGTFSVQPGRVQTVIGLSGAVSTQTPDFTTSYTGTSHSTSPSATGISKTGSPSSNSTASVSAVDKKSATQTIGFKAGLGVGIPVVCIALIAGILFYFFRPTRRRPTSPSNTPVGEAYYRPAEGQHMNRPTITQNLYQNASGGASGARPTTPTSRDPFDDINAPSPSSTPGNTLGGRNGRNGGPGGFHGPSLYPPPP